MVDAEGRRDRPDFPVFAEIEAPHLGALCGRDHHRSCGRRGATASESATDSPGHRRHSVCGRARRRLRGDESGGRDGGAGSLIPHAAPVRTLMVPVIEAACSAALMAGFGRPHRAPPPEPATARRAVRVPAVTRRTDREEAIALPTSLLTERLVHGGDARRTTADWTSRPNRGTTGTTGSVCRRARRSRGSGGSVRALILSPSTLPETGGLDHRGGYGRRPQSSSSSRKTKTRSARRPTGSSTIVQIRALSGERQQFEKRIPVKRCDKFTIKAQKTGLFPGSHRLG